MSSRQARSLALAVLVVGGIDLVPAPTSAAGPDSTLSAAPRPTASAPT